MGNHGSGTLRIAPNLLSRRRVFGLWLLALNAARIRLGTKICMHWDRMSDSSRPSSTWAVLQLVRAEANDPACHGRDAAETCLQRHRVDEDVQHTGQGRGRGYEPLWREVLLTGVPDSSAVGTLAIMLAGSYPTILETAAVGAVCVATLQVALRRGQACTWDESP